jgi:Activator of Hsp90 ATPase homolog 1-like protein
VNEPIELTFTVPCDPDHAFDVWTARTTMWWPPSHSVSQDPHLSVAIEPKVGGRIFERTTDGEEHDWGEVLAWDPPARFAYLWHLRQDRADATEVEISFSPAPDGTEVRIVHRGWERLGAKGPGLQQRNRQGWAGVLPHFQEACRSGLTAP